VAGSELLEELLQYPSCPTGGAVLTRGYRLPAKYVIHAVGPVWRGGNAGEPALLESAYESSFARAREAGDIRTIAFPGISTGIYRFPKPLATRTALEVMRRHEPQFDEIVACVFDDETAKLYEEGLANLDVKSSTEPV
jgi:O-acetyl-ADP-ribose deacetylase (regulator of RNase III)